MYSAGFKTLADYRLRFLLRLVSQRVLNEILVIGVPSVESCIVLNAVFTWMYPPFTMALSVMALTIKSAAASPAYVVSVMAIPS